MSFNKSLKTTWNLFNIAPKKFAHLSLILAPTFTAFGAFFFLALFIPTGIAVLISVALLIGMISIMVSTSEDEDRLVERYLDPPNQKEYTPPVDINRPREITPDYYQGAGEWIAPGHLDSFLFIETVREMDPHVRALPDKYVYSLVKHDYVINTYASRTNRDAIKFVPEGTPNSYPVTHIHVPYDHYVHAGYPYPAPVTPPPYLLEDTASHAIIKTD